MWREVTYPIYRALYEHFGASLVSLAGSTDMDGFDHDNVPWHMTIWGFDNTPEGEGLLKHVRNGEMHSYYLWTGKESAHEA